MGFLTTTVGKKERAVKGHQEVAFPPDMRRCKDNLRIPPSKYSPRECVWGPKSERPTRKQHHEYEAARRWHAQAWRWWAVTAPCRGRGKPWSRLVAANVGWCWWAMGSMGDAPSYEAARDAAVAEIQRRMDRRMAVL